MYHLRQLLLACVVLLFTTVNATWYPDPNAALDELSDTWKGISFDDAADTCTVEQFNILTASLGVAIDEVVIDTIVDNINDTST